MRLGVLASGSGSNLQAILDGCASGKIPAQVAVVVCNVPGARALERARAAGVPTVLLEHKQFSSRDEYDRELVAMLRREPDVGRSSAASQAPRHVFIFQPRSSARKHW